MNELTGEEAATLQALSELVDLIDKDDYSLIHETVRTGVTSGEITKLTEQAYKLMIDEKLG